ncbi:MAG: hypothetical protein AAGD07_07455 [Planctomycetota bacterium]
MPEDRTRLPTVSGHLANLALLAGVVCAVIPFAAGCGRDRPADTPMSAQKNTTQIDPREKFAPREFVKFVLQRYQSASFYADQGIVTLEARRRGQVIRRTAPLSVQVDGLNLDLDAYALRLRVRIEDGEKLSQTAWYDEPATKNLESQVRVSVRNASGLSRLPLAWLLQDPVTQDRLHAGLGGPPPQLEWLFAENPMPGLFDADAEFQWVSETDDAVMSPGPGCYGVEVRAESDRYVFWIDAEENAFRQVDLPLPLAGGGVQPMHLRLDLASATFSPSRAKQTMHAASWPAWRAVPVPRFLIPPAPLNPLIGRRLPRAFPFAEGRPSITLCSADPEGTPVEPVIALADLDRSMDLGTRAAVDVFLTTPMTERFAALPPAVQARFQLLSGQVSSQLHALTQNDSDTLVLADGSGRIVGVSAATPESIRGIENHLKDLLTGHFSLKHLQRSDVERRDAFFRRLDQLSRASR